MLRGVYHYRKTPTSDPKLILVDWVSRDENYCGFKYIDPITGTPTGSFGNDYDNEPYKFEESFDYMVYTKVVLKNEDPDTLDETEYYINKLTGDLFLVNFKSNRPDLYNWAKISRKAYENICNMRS